MRGPTQYRSGPWASSPSTGPVPSSSCCPRPHLAALAFLVLLNVGLSRFARSSESTTRRIRIGLVAALWTNEVIWHLWLMRNSTWDLQHALPWELCSIFVWVGGVMLLTRSTWLYDLGYFLGVAGALQALATPNIGIYGFPHYRFWASSSPTG